MMWREAAGFVGQGAVSSSFCHLVAEMPIYPLPTVFFVPEYISESDFLQSSGCNRKVLPGSILCKTLAGIGYFVRRGRRWNDSRWICLCGGRICL